MILVDTCVCVNGSVDGWGMKEWGVWECELVRDVTDVHRSMDPFCVAHVILRTTYQTLPFSFL
jgi:hypothetical protein